MPNDSEADWLLRNLVKIVDSNDGLTIGITLQVSGMLVSGSLIGGKHYFMGFSQVISSGFGDIEVSASVREAFGKYAEIYEVKGDDDDEYIPPNYIHLRDARFFNTSGNPIPGNMGVWWRGRISEVGGFILGILGAEES